MADILYDAGLDEWGTWLSGSVTYKFVAMQSTYTPDRTHATWAAMSAHECSTAGYAKATVADTTRTVDTVNHRIVYDCSDPSLGAPAGTQEIRYFVLYRLAAPESNSVPMACYEVTPFNTDGSTIVPTVDASGLHYVDQAA